MAEVPVSIYTRTDAAKPVSFYTRSDKKTYLLKLDLNGADGSTTITDTSTSGVDSPHTCTAINSAQIDTSQSASGGASLQILNASNDYVTIPTSQDFHWAQDITIEFDVRFKSFLIPTASKANTFFTHGLWNVEKGIMIAHDIIAGVHRINMVTAASAIGAASTYVQPIADLVIDTWYNMKFVGKSGVGGTNFEIFIDDVSQGSSTFAASSLSSTINQDLDIGRYLNSYSMDGWIDNFHFYQGPARPVTFYTRTN